MPSGTRQTSAGLYYEAAGSGAPILFLHGFGQSRYSWRHIIPGLGGRFRTYAVDLKGFGCSPKPIDSQYTLHDQSDWVVALIESHHLESPILVGHSMGGAIALLTAMRLQRTANQVSKLVLIDSIAYLQRMPAFITVLRTPILGRLSTLLPPEALVAAVMRLAYFDNAKIPTDAVREYARAIREPGGRHSLVCTARSLVPEDINALTQQYLSLAVPTAIIWGKHDRIVPLRIGQRLNEALPNSRLHVVDCSGHIPHEEVPSVSCEIILRFLHEL